MLTFDLLDEWLPRLQHPAVRDLAWTLLAAPLLEDSPCAQRHPLTASEWAQHPGQLAGWLQYQDQHPSALLDWLAQPRSQRLGIYYERLWQFALLQAPGIQLLGANLPIRQDGLTLGELDLLLRDSEGVHHLELAIKLYLGPADGNGHMRANWRGAGRADNLERKLQHLTQQQLPLSSTPQAQQILANFAVTDLHAELWMSGYLFYPWPAGSNPPAGCHPDHRRACWLRRDAWTAFVASTSAQHWQPIPRDCRLAPLSFTEETQWTTEQLQGWLRTLPADTAPTLLVGFAQTADGKWFESERVMLLNDRWPALPEH